MKIKMVSLLGAILSASMAFSAQFNWDAGYFTSDFAGGTCYVLHVASGSTTVADIANYIATSGLTYTGDTVTINQIGTTSVQEAGGFYYANGSGIFADAGTYTNVFLLTLSADQSKYALSSFASITVNNTTPETLAAGTWDDWNEQEIMGWAEASGTVGSSGSSDPNDPTVPEPTALALLALGVAGLALRRRA